MTKYIYTVICLMTMITATNAQRMLPGQKGVEINTGTLFSRQLRHNYYFNAGLAMMKNEGNYVLVALEYTHERSTYKAKQIPLETYTAEAGYSLRLLSDARKWMNLNGTLTAVAGYERINKGDSILFDGSQINTKGGLVYGAGGRLSLETYLNDRLVLLIQGNAKLLWNTSRDRLRPSAGIGLRYNF